MGLHGRRMDAKFDTWTAVLAWEILGSSFPGDAYVEQRPEEHLRWRFRRPLLLHLSYRIFSGDPLLIF